MHTLYKHLRLGKEHPNGRILTALPPRMPARSRNPLNPTSRPGVAVTILIMVVMAVIVTVMVAEMEMEMVMVVVVVVVVVVTMVMMVVAAVNCSHGVYFLIAAVVRNLEKAEVMRAGNAR
jgi:hypothetical protein